MPLLLILLSFAFGVLAGPGTMSTDLTPASQAEASLSGTTGRADELLNPDETKEGPQKQEAREDMDMEDASSVEFDKNDPGVEEIAPPRWE